MIELPADQWYQPDGPDPVTVTLDNDYGMAVVTDQFGRVTLGFDGARRPEPPDLSDLELPPYRPERWSMQAEAQRHRIKAELIASIGYMPLPTVKDLFRISGC